MDSKILYVDLSSGSIREKVIDEAILKKYIGGSGLNAKLIYDYFKKYGRIEPLSEENMLVFSVGPLTGTGFPLTGRYYAASISPLTGIYGQSSAGDKFGNELRHCGYFSIVITGASEKPVYLKVTEDGIELKNAIHLWGKGTLATERELKKECPGSSVASIGPAGEHLVKFAAIINDGGRAAGRTGLGAVMGYKKLKAICLRGWKYPEIHDIEAFRSILNEALHTINKAPAAKVLRDYGTDGLLESLYDYGDVPIKNFSMGEWSREKIRGLSGQTIAKTILKRRYYCKSCPVGCGRITEVEGTEVHGPEYETVASFGPLLLNDNLTSIVKANKLCNDYGLDTISTGVTIAFALESVERGLLSKEVVGATWGDHEGILKLIEKIAKREGIGDLLAEGVRYMSRVLGEESKKFAMHVKGLEMPMHDPRAFASWALGYATSNRGACHTYAPVYYIEKGLTFPEIGLPNPLDRFDTKSKPRAVKLIQDLAEFLDSLVMCRFCLYSGIKLPILLRALEAVNGWKITVDEAMTIGERIFNLKRYINNLLGIRREDDMLPPRIFEPLHPPGGTYGFVPENFEEMLDEYYRLRGWTAEGIVPEDLLVKLGIE